MCKIKCKYYISATITMMLILNIYNIVGFFIS